MFNSGNLELLSVSTNPLLPQFFGYNAGNDTIADVSAGDYFKYFAESNVTGFYSFKFNIGDQIYCVCSDGTITLDIVGLTPDISTVVSAAGTAVMQSRIVSQTAHGFSVTDILKFAGGAYAKAQANNLANSQVVGMVAAIVSANEFMLVYGGYVTGLSGLVTNATYYLSPSVAGLLTTTEPTTAGQVSRPLFIATSASEGYFFLGRSNLIMPADTDTALSQVVTQNAHGFAVGEAIYLSALNTYAKAQANALATSRAVGVVSTVSSPNEFAFVSAGAISGLTGLTAAAAHYLSPTVAGALTTTAPTGAGQFIVSILDAASTTAGFVNIGQPRSTIAAVTEGGTGVGTLTTAYGTLCAGTNATNPVQTVSPGLAGQVYTSNGVSALPSFQTPISTATLSYPPTNAAQKAIFTNYRIAGVPGLFSSATLSDSQTDNLDGELATKVIFVPYFAFQAVSFQQIRLFVVTGVAASSVTAGYYASDANGLPTGAALAVGTATTTSSASQVVIGSLTINLSANTLYWFAVQASTSTTLAISTAPLGLAPGYDIAAPAATISQRWIGQTNTYSAGVLPTIGTLVQTGVFVSSLPVLWLI